MQIYVKIKAFGKVLDSASATPEAESARLI